jgi:hypothetical protein
VKAGLPVTSMPPEPDAQAEHAADPASGG